MASARGKCFKSKGGTCSHCLVEKWSDGADFSLDLRELRR